MVRKIKTYDDAAHEWVREFNAIPTDIIAKLMKMAAREGDDSWREVTIPTPGDRVNVYAADISGSGEITDYADDGYYFVDMGFGEPQLVENGDFEVDTDDTLPMWGTMWSFGDWCDDQWLELGEGIRLMSELGFRIYESDEYGYFFGIDGCGYDFYKEHWIPLYKARGLQWHETEEEANT